MRKITLFVQAVLLLSLVACKQNASIKVGFAGGLSGTNSELGVNGMYGAMQAVEEINAGGGVHDRPIELIIKDDQGNPQIGLEVDKELLKENCVAVIGHMTSDMAEESIPFINRERMLMISPTIALATLSSQDDYFFRLIPSTMEQAKQFSLEIQRLGIKDVLILSSLQNDIFAQSISSYLSSELTNNKISIQILESIDFTLPSQVKEIVEQIIQSNTEALVIIASADAVVQVSQALYVKNEQKVAFLPAWSMTNDLIQRGGDSVNNFYGISFIDYQNTLSKYQEFKRKYIKTYGEEPTFAAVMSYESIMVLYEALKQSPDLKSENLKRELLKLDVFQGLQGEIHIDEFGDAQREVYLYQIIDKAFVKVNDNE